MPYWRPDLRVCIGTKMLADSRRVLGNEILHSMDHVSELPVDNLIESGEDFVASRRWVQCRGSLKFISHIVDDIDDLFKDFRIIQVTYDGDSLSLSVRLN